MLGFDDARSAVWQSFAFPWYWFVRERSGGFLGSIAVLELLHGVFVRGVVAGLQSFV